MWWQKMKKVLDNGLVHEIVGYAPEVEDTGLESVQTKPTNVARVGNPQTGGGNNVHGFTITSTGGLIDGN